MSNTSQPDPSPNLTDLTGSIQNLGVEPMVWRRSSDLYLGDLVISGMSRKVNMFRIFQFTHLPML